jgi:hypothetical protein
MKATILYVIVFLLYTTCVFSQTSVTYTYSSSDFANTERGFYTHRETMAGSGGSAPMQSPLTLADLQDQRNNKNITIILRLYYLNRFRTSAISTSYLNSIQADMDNLRSAGLKAIVRFAYNNSIQTHRHSSDASLSWVLSHINQLQTIFQNNADVIMGVQSGLIGTWGE